MNLPPPPPSKNNDPHGDFLKAMSLAFLGVLLSVGTAIGFGIYKLFH